jgi:sphingomyelin phosphodiesterase acid-like 3
MRNLSMKIFGAALLLLALLANAAWAAQGLPWQPSDNEGTFLMVSDVHFDPYADPSLVKQLAAAPVDQWKSIFESSPQTVFSTYGKDTNYPLFKSFLAEAAQHGEYDYVLVNGDYLSHGFRANFNPGAHGGEKAYQDFALKTVVFVSRCIQDAFPGKPVYFCLGNNDSDCDDYGGLIQGTAFLPTLAKEWTTVAQDPAAVKSFLEGGYYSVSHPTLKGRRFIVFNDVSWSKKYAPACSTTMDISKEEMEWLAGVLQQARASNERITLITHMPPGVHGRNASEHEDRTKPQHTFYSDSYLWPFLNLLAPYRDLLDGEFCGHTHMDDFRVVRDRGGKSVFFVHITPAVSPVRFNNPGFQVMLYDRKTGNLEDMATYYVPLASAGEGWKLEYDFKQAYSLEAYDSKNLITLAESIENDPKVRAQYIQYVCVSSTDNPPATMDNWKFFSCTHLNLDPASYMQCYK